MWQDLSEDSSLFSSKNDRNKNYIFISYSTEQAMYVNSYTMKAPIDK